MTVALFWASGLKASEPQSASNLVWMARIPPVVFDAVRLSDALRRVEAVSRSVDPDAVGVTVLPFFVCETRGEDTTVTADFSRGEYTLREMMESLASVTSLEPVFRGRFLLLFDSTAGRRVFALRGKCVDRFSGLPLPMTSLSFNNALDASVVIGADGEYVAAVEVLWVSVGGDGVSLDGRPDIDRVELVARCAGYRTERWMLAVSNLDFRIVNSHMVMLQPDRTTPAQAVPGGAP